MNTRKTSYMKQWLIAYDAKGYYIREVLCVTHDGVRGEAIYHTKPRGRAETFKEALGKARKIESEPEGTEE